jgi:CDP-diacylglycerol---glycerol-3-phosphate 3-phosphatidyltransferase
MLGRLKHLAPLHRIDAAHVHFRNSPEQLWRQLCASADNAKHSLCLAALYIGGRQRHHDVENENDRFETHELLDSLLRASKRIEQCTLLLDRHRSSRLDRETSWIREQLQESNVRLELWSPNRWLEFGGSRAREVLGVQHIKALVADTSQLVVSGANFSDSYFSNRQDRCVAIDGAAELCAHVERVLDSVATSRLNDDVVLPPSPTTLVGDGDTLALATVQSAPFNVRQDERVLDALLDSLDDGWRIDVASPYFNLSERRAAQLLDRRHGSVRVVTSSPRANGFYGANGLAGYIPHAYSLCEQRFFERIDDHERVSIVEYERGDGWTFHAKGMWLTSPGETRPTLTLIGSGNMGRRSQELDTELQLYIESSESALRDRMAAERDAIMSAHTRRVSASTFEERQSPALVRLAIPLLQRFM